MEEIGLGMQTECFVQQPVAFVCIVLFAVIAGLVSAAGQPASVGQSHGEAELLCLGGMDIKKGDIVSDNPAGFSVSDRDQVKPFSEKTCLFGAEQSGDQVLYD